MKPYFVAFEGIDGSGKSTQSKLLYSNLLDLHIPVDLSKEPTEGPIGTLIREVLIGDKKINNLSLEALFKLDRFEHEETIKVLQRRGIVCLTDRSIISGIAYDTNKTKSLEDSYEEHKHVKLPNITFFVDVPVETALARIAKRCEETGTQPDIYETQEQLETIRYRFLKILDYYGKEKLTKVYIINGDQSEDDIQAEILSTLQNHQEG